MLVNMCNDRLTLSPFFSIHLPWLLLFFNSDVRLFFFVNLKLVSHIESLEHKYPHMPGIQKTKYRDLWWWTLLNARVSIRFRETMSVPLKEILHQLCAELNFKKNWTKRRATTISDERSRESQIACHTGSGVLMHSWSTTKEKQKRITWRKYL